MFHPRQEAVDQLLRSQSMRLAPFILANLEPILVMWEDFARSIWPVALTDPTIDAIALRDHAEEILRSTAAEMMASQTTFEQSEKSQGRESGSRESADLNAASELHGVCRFDSGFELWAVVAEYRALRAAVIRLWRDSHPGSDGPGRPGALQ